MIRLLMSLAVAMAVAVSSATAGQLPRPDGSLIDYTLDPAPGAPAGLVVLLSGSGCLPGSVSESLAMARAHFPNHDALIVEKAGVSTGAGIVDGFTDCPAVFHARHTVSQRVSDTAQVITEITRDAPAQQVVLFGGSEGGLTAALLSNRVSADAVILVSSGPAMMFEDLVLATVPPEGKAQVAAGFAAARADPQGTTLVAGSSHRFWADILPLRGLDPLLQTTAPILLIQGGLDTSSPLSSAREAADAFALAGRCNLTYWEFPALDHGMTDPSGTSHMDSVIQMSAAWAAMAKPTC